MAINFSNGFNIIAAEPVDVRIVKTKAQMANMSVLDEKRMPNVYFCICSDDNNVYVYNKANDPTAETGRFRLYAAGSGAVESVNGKTGAVVLNANDVNALPDTTVIPTKTSDLTNDSGFLTAHQDISGKLDKPIEPIVGQGVNVPYYFDVTYGADKVTVRDYTVDLLDKDKAPAIYSLDIATATTGTAGLESAADKTKLDSLVTVSGTNDGTNWATITIDGVTKAIPNGGGGATYTAGDGIEITNNEISVNDTVVRSSAIADMATKTWVEGKGYLTEHQSLTGYATEAWVEGKGYLTQHQDISGKQDKLTAGEGINITNNLIKSLVSDKLSTDITSDYTVGGINAGDVIPAGTSFEDILKKLLVRPTPSTVEIYVGAINEVPPVGFGGLDKKVVQKTELISTTGLDYIIKSGEIATEKSQFRVIACPIGYKLSDWINKNTSISVMSNVTKTTLNAYNFYHLVPAVYDEDLGGEEFIFKFMEE